MSHYKTVIDAQTAADEANLALSNAKRNLNAFETRLHESMTVGENIPCAICQLEDGKVAVKVWEKDPSLPNRLFVVSVNESIHGRESAMREIQMMFDTSSKVTLAKDTPGLVASLIQREAELTKQLDGKTLADLVAMDEACAMFDKGLNKVSYQHLPSRVAVLQREIQQLNTPEAARFKGCVIERSGIGGGWHCVLKGANAKFTVSTDLATFLNSIGIRNA